MRTQLSEVLDDGEKLITSDGREWMVSMGGILTARFWPLGSFVDIAPVDDSTSPTYELTNLTTGVPVQATKLD